MRESFQNASKITLRFEYQYSFISYDDSGILQVKIPLFF
jgi:hypothetical protein